MGKAVKALAKRARRNKLKRPASQAITKKLRGRAGRATRAGMASAMRGAVPARGVVLVPAKSKG